VYVSRMFARLQDHGRFYTEAILQDKCRRKGVDEFKLDVLPTTQVMIPLIRSSSSCWLNAKDARPARLSSESIATSPLLI
jgi:hypothetical protein